MCVAFVAFHSFRRGSSVESGIRSKCLMGFDGELFETEDASQFEVGSDYKQPRPGLGQT